MVCGLQWRAFGIEGDQIHVWVIFRLCVLVHKRRWVNRSGFGRRCSLHYHNSGSGEAKPHSEEESYWEDGMS
jgi:hypothetical protein